MVWERNPNVPYPSVWRKFQAQSKETGEILNFQIQDATEDMIPDIIDLMFNYFIPEEPVAKCFDLGNHRESIPHIKMFYSALVQARTVLVCIKVDEKNKSRTVVGCNMTFVSEPNFDFSAVIQTKVLADYVNIFSHLGKQCNIFEKFNVDYCLKAAGLTVHEKYRGLGISVEILKARTEFCQALKIPLTATEFTSSGGQACARKSGFHLLFEKKYKDIMKEIPNVPLQNITHPITQLMYKIIDL